MNGEQIRTERRSIYMKAVFQHLPTETEENNDVTPSISCNTTKIRDTEYRKDSYRDLTDGQTTCKLRKDNCSRDPQMGKTTWKLRRNNCEDPQKRNNRKMRKDSYTGPQVDKQPGR